MTKDEEDFRLRPRKPRSAGRRNDATWSVLFKSVVHYARVSRTAGGARSGKAGTRPTRLHSQRCAVRVTYSPNKVKGRWRAHGRYLERDSATGERISAFSGFDAQGEGIEVASRLAEWEKAGDERLWKLIVSPEFGERLDLKKLARETLQRMENDLGTPLQLGGRFPLQY